jgi:hypothetical protein
MRELSVLALPPRALARVKGRLWRGGAWRRVRGAGGAVPPLPCRAARGCGNDRTTENGDGRITRRGGANAACGDARSGPRRAARSCVRLAHRARAARAAARGRAAAKRARTRDRRSPGRRPRGDRGASWQPRMRGRACSGRAARAPAHLQAPVWRRGSRRRVGRGGAAARRKEGSACVGEGGKWREEGARGTQNERKTEARTAARAAPAARRSPRPRARGGALSCMMRMMPMQRCKSCSTENAR